MTIDGLDNNDEFTGDTRTELSLEFVREFQVVSNGWAVENGGGSGGSINVVTRSGANTLHGDVFLFGQSGIFNARPKLEETLGSSPSLGRYRGGLAVGGPILKDRTFYYAAVEREQAHSDGIRYRRCCRGLDQSGAGRRALARGADAEADDRTVSDVGRGNGVGGKGVPSTRGSGLPGRTDRCDAERRAT